MIAFIWILMASICAGCLMHFFPDEWNPHDPENSILAMYLGLTCWWLFAVMGIGYLILKVLSKLPLFIAGFLNGWRDNQDGADMRGEQNV